MIIELPNWYGKASEKLDKCIDEIIIENHIDWHFSHDSNSIEKAKDTILMALYSIYENVSVEERKRMEEVTKKERKNKKVRKVKRAKKYRRRIRR